MFGIGNKKNATAKHLLRLKIDGMHCTSCTMTIDDSIEELPGVVRSSTNYAKSATVVEYEPGAVTTDAILAAVREVGYGVTIVGE